MTEGDREQELMDQSDSTHMFAVNQTPDMGMNPENSVGNSFIANGTSVLNTGVTGRYGGSFKEGGSYELDDNEIQQFLAAGGTIEYLD